MDNVQCIPADPQDRSGLKSILAVTGSPWEFIHKIILMVLSMLRMGVRGEPDAVLRQNQDAEREQPDSVRTEV